MTTLNMNDLLAIINADGYKARYEMTGGNVGTISFEVSDEMGDLWISIGPSNFETSEANSDDLCITVHEQEAGEDGMCEERIIYWNQEQHGEFTVQNIANAVFDQLVPLD